MKTFAVYAPEDKHFAKFEFIKEGFNWIPFFLGVMWSLYHKLFKVSIGILIIYFFIGFFMGLLKVIDPVTQGLVELMSGLLIGLFCGFSAHDWMHNSLLKKHFTFVRTVKACNLSEAKEIFFKGDMPNQTM